LFLTHSELLRLRGALSVPSSFDYANRNQLSSESAPLLRFIAQALPLTFLEFVSGTKTVLSGYLPWFDLMRIHMSAIDPHQGPKNECHRKVRKSDIK
jgi:hypothetical protein